MFLNMIKQKNDDVVSQNTFLKYVYNRYNKRKIKD